MARSTVQPEIPIIATVLVHALLAAGLVLAGDLIDRRPQRVAEGAGEMTEIERLPPPTPRPERKPEPDPVPATTEPVTQPVDTRPQRTVTRTRQTTATTRTETRPVISDPAPGVNDNDDEAAPTYALPDQGAGGSIPVPRGVAPRGPLGTGGKGTNRGGGGTPADTGTAPAPAPVSVAAIKRRATAIGDVDHEYIGRNYPAEAKRLGVEGKVKVRLVVDATGAVTSRKLVVKLGHGLDELAMKLASKLRFEPAIDTDDKPVSSVVVWTFTFVLPKS